jgi:hypothetical protein
MAALLGTAAGCWPVGESAAAPPGDMLEGMTMGGRCCMASAAAGVPAAPGAAVRLCAMACACRRAAPACTEMR